MHMYPTTLCTQTTAVSRSLTVHKQPSHVHLRCTNSRLMFTYGAQTAVSCSLTVHKQPSHVHLRCTNHVTSTKSKHSTMTCFFGCFFNFVPFFLIFFLQAMETSMKIEDHHFTVRSFLNIHSCTQSNPLPSLSAHSYSQTSILISQIL